MRVNSPYIRSRSSINESSDNFFVEAGAYDGEFYSNTLLLERDYGWNGILIEPNPNTFKLLLQKNRKVWSINACLSTKPYVEVKQFDARGIFGGIVEKGIGPTQHQVRQ